MLNVLDLALFRIFPVGLYLVAALLMSVGVMPVAISLFRREKEYVRVAFLMLVVTTTQFITSLVAVSYLYCFLFSCSVDETPYRGVVRIIIALNIFSSALGFFILFNTELVRRWFNGKKK